MPKPKKKKKAVSVTPLPICQAGLFPHPLTPPIPTPYLNLLNKKTHPKFN